MDTEGKGGWLASVQRFRLVCHHQVFQPLDWLYDRRTVARLRRVPEFFNAGVGGISAVV